jgi:hypothetical protein
VLKHCFSSFDFIKVYKDMEKLHEYRKIIKIRCESINEGQNNNYFTFEVKFEQLRSHQLFKYSVVKHKEEVIQLYVLMIL